MTRWLRDILESVWREQDRELLREEALECLNAGALRSAYIMTWVTVAESLKATLREMSIRDNEIQKIVGKIEELESQEKSVDGFLLGKSIELGIIPPDYHQRIRHLYMMRSLYTHPYETGPSKDEVRAAIRIAVEGVLSRRPFFRQGYINDRLDALFHNPHFLDDDSQKIEAYGKELAERVDPTLQRYFIERLISGLEPIVDDPELETILRRCLGVAIAFLCQVDADLSSDQWQAVSLLERWPKATSLIFRDPKIWKKLGEQAQDMTLSLQLFPPGVQGIIVRPGSRSLEIFVSALEKEELTQRQSENVRKAVGLTDLQALANSLVPMVHWVDRIINDLKTYNWFVQNPAVSAFRTAGVDRIQRECDDTTLESLGRNILQAAEGSARSASAFLSKLGTTETSWPGGFLRGVLFEGFVNEEGKIRFKTRAMKVAIVGVLRNSREQGTALIEELALLLRKGEPKNPPLYDSEIPEVLRACDNALAELTEDEEVLRVAVRNLQRALVALPTEQSPPSPF